jgi:hypothetical protein
MQDLSFSLLNKPLRYIYDGDWARVYDGNTGRYLGMEKDGRFLSRRSPRRYRVAWPAAAWQRV